MKAFSAVLIVALVAQASASPCTDICNGSCDMVQQTVGLLFPQIATIVAPNIEICRQSCTAVCTCTDGCTAQCSPAYEACISAAKAAYNPFSMVVCQAQYAVCAGPCNMQCSSTIVSGLVQQVQGFAATISQTVSVAVGQLMGPTSSP